MNAKALKEQLNTDDIITLEETWVDIDGYDGIYQVSNYGRVKSFKNHSERILKGGIDGRGYAFVNLRKNNENQLYRIHRLVGKHFIPNPNNYPCINHKDENKVNNYADNLEWCTYQYNANYGTKPQRLSESMKKLDYNKKKVAKYDLNGNLIEVYDGVREAERQHHIGNGSVSKSCRGEAGIIGGYIWRYIDEPFDKYDYTDYLHNIEVIQLDKNNNFINKFSSITEAAKLTGCDKTCIIRCCKHKQKTSLGYKWSYADEYSLSERDIAK